MNTSKVNRLLLDDMFDLLRGVSALTESRLVGAIAETLVRHPEAPLSNALNHKQVICKQWLIDGLAGTSDRRFAHILIVGGWLGTLSAMLFDRLDARIGRITTLDIDPDCRPVAETLNRRHRDAGRFCAVTADMMTLDLPGLATDQAPIDLVINTSCEHIADVRTWLDQLPKGQTVVLQSNDYVREPEHVSCVPDLATFRDKAALAHVDFGDRLALKNYTRFMLIGRV